ncbi:MAG TPA: OmpP1/FadL family transporter [Rhizomicrobium sp.]|jgi:long-chain fatty acid transport protein
MRARLHARCSAKRLFLFLICSFAFLAHASRPAFSGAFLNQIQSAGAASVSTAGETAIAEDATTVYYNAAGMTSLPHPEISFTVPTIFLSSHFQNNGTTAGLGDPAHGSSGNKDQNFPIPSFFATLPLTDRVTVGLGLFIPFGQSNAYPDDWVGRYQLQRISLKTLDVDPAIAYRLTDSLSVGGGIDLQYAHIVRNNALDLGALCIVTIGPGTCTGLGLGPQGADGRQLVTAANWGVGFNIGLLYVLDDATHIGLNYRSAVRHDFKGTAIFQAPAIAVPLTASGLFQNTGVRSPLTFPDVIALGISHQLNDRLTILADMDWTGWHRLSQLTLDFANPVQPDETLPLHWSNSIRFAVGGIYSVSDNIGLRAGISWDETPTSITYRSAELPDANEFLGSVGLSYRIDEQLSTIASYSYGHYSAAPVDLSQLGSGTLAGTFRRTSNAIALQLLVGL